MMHEAIGLDPEFARAHATLQALPRGRGRGRAAPPVPRPLGGRDHDHRVRASLSRDDGGECLKHVRSVAREKELIYSC